MTTGISVRRRRKRDWRHLLRILKQGFPAWYRRIPYLFFYTIVATDRRGSIAGFVSMPMRKGQGEIGLIAVAAGSHGQGLGHLLLSAALDIMTSNGMRSCVAKVRPNNEPAIRLFASLGFERSHLVHRRLLGDVYRVVKQL